SLFDLTFGGDMALQETRALPPLPDCTLRARLSMEREIAGVYITGHPLDDHRDTLSHFAFSTADLADLEEREDHGMALDGQIVEMGGILTEVKGKATKKGAYMGFVTLEDLTGQIECLVFPKIYERYQGMMAPDDLVVLTGRLSIREDESPKLLVESMDSLEDWKPGQGQARPAPRTSPRPRPAQEDAPRPAPAPVHHAPEAPRLTDAQLAAKASRKLYLRLKRADMDRAAALLALHPGSVPVYMHLPDEKITLLAPKLSWCDATDACLRRLQSAYGADNVRLVSK
ncbi:MAG: OB-fold nucleic acid binding domain-containing protein, partial [Aristaeellaceae bacterium]